MLTDAYVQFGSKDEDTEAREDALDPDIPEDKDKLQELRTPLIEGDSDDDSHYWWCELRGCDFSLESHDRGSDDESHEKEEKESNPSFKTVTLKKRYDWASVELFYRCCEAGRQKVERKKEDDMSRINMVTVEICRTAAKRGQQEGFNFAFLIIRYRGVRIQKFKLDLSSTEPSETIEFEFEELDVEFQPTDPYTGLKSGEMQRLRKLKNHHPKVGRVRGQHVQGNGSTGTSGGSGPTDGYTDGMTAPPGSSNLVSTGVSFPGLQPQNGVGILPH